MTSLKARIAVMKRHLPSKNPKFTKCGLNYPELEPPEDAPMCLRCLSRD